MTVLWIENKKTPDIVGRFFGMRVDHSDSSHNPFNHNCAEKI